MNNEPLFSKDDKSMLTCEEVAGILQLSRRTVWNMVKGHELPFVKVGRRIRFPRAAWDAWMRDQNRNALARPHTEGGGE